MANKPFLLRPTGKDYLWGGRRLKDDYEKHIDITPLAETWECSTHPDGPSFVGSGEFFGSALADVLKEHPEYVGVNGATDGQLPILVKFIDAESDLSVQVHPTDEYSLEHEGGQLGKSEMWYVLDAFKDASLIYGFTRDTDEATVRAALADGKIMNLLQSVKVQKDDVFFLQAGTVHAIGAGTLIAEIQENSNLTYRMYDYDRVDKYGCKRELHVDKAMEVANFKASVEPRQPMRVLKYRPGVASELLCRCKYFEVQRVLLNTERGQVVKYQADELSYRVILCLQGSGRVSWEDGGHGESLDVRKGDCIFVPADSVEMTVTGAMQFLFVRG